MSVDQYKKEVGMMNLEALIESRESISKATFPIPDKELLYRFEQLYTGAVNDVLREFCLIEQALPGRILPLREYRTVAGFAFTVKSDSWQKREDGSYLRTINSINELFDVSPVYKAAYSSTTVNTRGLDELKQKEQKEIDEYYQELEAKLK